MPDKQTIERAQRDKREGKAPSTQAGEFVREEMDHIREGKHGARSPEQAIAIGLSKARRAGVQIPAQKGGKPAQENASGAKKKSAARSTATRNALKREGHSAASKPALSEHSRATARRRGHKSLSASARKAARTRSHETGRS
jgi:hypothetical protein